MGLHIRRVVTGHDAEGRSSVEIDDVASALESKRAGHESCVVWTTKGFPVDNTVAGDPAAAGIPTAIEDGTVFRVVRYAPGVSPRMHRTHSLDYGVVLQGQIDMELDDGMVVSLSAGDLLVQRGTIHSWVNNGADDCVIAFVLISAEPVTVGGRPLEVTG